MNVLWHFLSVVQSTAAGTGLGGLPRVADDVDIIIIIIIIIKEYFEVPCS